MKMEKGPKAKECGWPLETEKANQPKKGNRFPPKASEEEHSLEQLNFSLGRPVSDL